MERKPEKIRILFTIPNFDTAGSGKALLNIATRLERTNFEPHIACSHNKGVFFNVVEGSGIPVHLLQTTTSMTNRFNGFLQCWKISRKMKEINPDMIHSFHYAPDYSEALAAWFAGIPWIFTKKNMNWGGKSKNSWILRSFLAKHIVILNTDMKKIFYPKSYKTTLIYRGIDLNEFSMNIKNKSLQNIGIPQDSKVIMVVANLAPVKGIEYLIDAFKFINDEDNSTYLIIVGEKNNEYGIRLQKMAKFTKSDKIIFLGKRNDVASVLQFADIFVLPTVYNKGGEGLPVSLLEAMASGIPVLASNVSGNRDVLKSMPDQLFAPENVMKLADKLNWMLDLKNYKINQIVKNQLFIVQKYFSISLEVKRHSELFKHKILN